MAQLAQIVRGVHVLYVALLIAAPWLMLAGAALRIDALCSTRVRRAHRWVIGLTALQFITGCPCPLSMLENVLVGRPVLEPFLRVDPSPWAMGSSALLYLLATAGVEVWIRRRGQYAMRGTHP